MRLLCIINRPNLGAYLHFINFKGHFWSKSENLTPGVTINEVTLKSFAINPRYPKGY